MIQSVKWQDIVIVVNLIRMENIERIAVLPMQIIGGWKMFLRVIEREKFVEYLREQSELLNDLATEVVKGEELTSNLIWRIDFDLYKDWLRDQVELIEEDSQ